MNPYGKCSLIAEKFTAQAAIIEFSILSYPLEYWFCKLKTTKTKTKKSVKLCPMIIKRNVFLKPYD